MTLHTFDIPKLLNGGQLKEELAAENIYALDEKLIIDSNKSYAEIAAILKQHLPHPIVELTLVQKLARLGITADEAKLLIG